MKPQPCLLALCLVLPFISACGSPVVAPPLASGMVNVTNNHGTASLWKIDFEVLETGSGGARATGGGLKWNAAGEALDTCELGLGDVTIEAVKGKDGTVAITIGGRSYASVAAGDKVVVAADRTVTVNGIAREPQ